MSGTLLRVLHYHQFLLLFFFSQKEMFRGKMYRIKASWTLNKEFFVQQGIQSNTLNPNPFVDICFFVNHRHHHYLYRCIVIYIYEDRGFHGLPQHLFVCNIAWKTVDAITGTKSDNRKTGVFLQQQIALKIRLVKVKYTSV